MAAGALIPASKRPWNLIENLSFHKIPANSFDNRAIVHDFGSNQLRVIRSGDGSFSEYSDSDWKLFFIIFFNNLAY